MKAESLETETKFQFGIYNCIVFYRADNGIFTFKKEFISERFTEQSTVKFVKKIIVSNRKFILL